MKYLLKDNWMAMSNWFMNFFLISYKHPLNQENTGRNENQRTSQSIIKII